MLQLLKRGEVQSYWNEEHTFWLSPSESIGYLFFPILSLFVLCSEKRYRWKKKLPKIEANSYIRFLVVIIDRLSTIMPSIPHKYRFISISTSIDRMRRCALSGHKHRFWLKLNLFKYIICANPKWIRGLVKHARISTMSGGGKKRQWYFHSIKSSSLYKVAGI